MSLPVRLLRTSSRGSARRVRRSLSPGGPPEIALDPRLLTAPVFFLNQAPGFASGLAEASASSDVPAADGAEPTTVSQTNDAAGVGDGIGASSHLSNNVIYNVQQTSGGSELTNEASVTEDGTSAITLGLPADVPDPGGGPVAVQFHASMTNTDQVQTDANGPYNIDVNPFSGDGQQSSLRSTSPINLLIANPDGSPTSGTVHVTFDAAMSAPDASGVDGTPRFTQVAEINLSSPYFDIVANQDDNSVEAVDHNTGAVLASGSLSNFTYTGVYPITSGNIPVSYASILYSGPEGTFGGTPGAPAGEHASHIASFTWDFTMTATAAD